MPKKIRTALIDADAYCYAAAFSAESKYNFGGEDIVEVDEDAAIAKAESLIADSVAEVEADELILCLSSPRSDVDLWRFEVLPSYKSNRKAKPKPEAYPAVRRHLEATYDCYMEPRLEADDIMTLLSSDPTMIPGIKVVVSQDKDLLQTIGRYYNPRTREKRIIKADESNRWHMMQTLQGDTVDGYKGIPGIGPKKAEKILEDVAWGDRWAAVVEAYESKGLTEEDALAQARVAYMMQTPSYDWTTKEVTLWTPDLHPPK